MKSNTELLFSYGTLQLRSVQLDTFGRELTGHEDTLIGYRVEALEITDPQVLSISQQQYHPILIKTKNINDTVTGMVFEITHEELLKADHYEVDDYQRVLGDFLSGRKAWIYASK